MDSETQIGVEGTVASPPGRSLECPLHGLHAVGNHMFQAHMFKKCRFAAKAEVNIHEIAVLNVPPATFAQARRQAHQQLLESP